MIGVKAVEWHEITWQDALIGILEAPVNLSILRKINAGEGSKIRRSSGGKENTKAQECSTATKHCQETEG